VEASAMASNNSYPKFPFPVMNPHTSLAFLSPTEAGQIEATRFLYVSSLAVQHFHYSHLASRLTFHHRHSYGT
jgi:hypothetical protein